MMIIGALLGGIAAYLCCIVPALETPIMVGVVVGTQNGLISPEIALSLLIIKSGLEYGTSLLEEGDIKRANTKALCGLTTASPIMLGCAVLLLIAGVSRESITNYLPGMSSSLAGLSMVAIPMAIGSHWYLCVPREKKLIYGGLLLVATIGTVITIKCSGTPMGMAVVALALSMKLPSPSKGGTHSNALVSHSDTRPERALPTELEFTSSLFATILIGLSPSLLYSVGASLYKRKEGVEINGDPSMGNHLQKLLGMSLLLTVGLGRDTTADSIKRVLGNSSMSPFMGLILLVITWLIAWQITENLDLLREWKSQYIPSLGLTWEWATKCLCLALTFILLGLPLWMGAIAILIGIAIGEVSERFGVGDILKTPFSTLPLLGISGVI